MRTQDLILRLPKLLAPLAMLLAIPLSALSAWAAAPYLSVGNVSGVPGSSLSLPISLTAGIPGVVGLQFDIALPLGITYGSAIAGASAIAGEKFPPFCSLQTGTTYRCLVIGFNASVIPSGEVVILLLSVNANAAAGTYPITLTGIQMTDINSNPTPVGPTVPGSIVIQSPSSPQLSLTKSVDRPTAHSGDILTYTISYQNISSGDALAASIKDTVPIGSSLVPGSISNGGSLSGGLVQWSLGTVSASNSGSVSFKVQVQ